MLVGKAAPLGTNTALSLFKAEVTVSAGATASARDLDAETLVRDKQGNRSLGECQNASHVAINRFEITCPVLRSATLPIPRNPSF